MESTENYDIKETKDLLKYLKKVFPRDILRYRGSLNYTIDERKISYVLGQQILIEHIEFKLKQQEKGEV